VQKAVAWPWLQWDNPRSCREIWNRSLARAVVSFHFWARNTGMLSYYLTWASKLCASVYYDIGSKVGTINQENMTIGRRIYCILLLVL
jgi:hypothetical protein